MKNIPTKEELTSKYGTCFSDLKELSFGVEFPNGDKSVLRPMKPRQYKAFMRTFEGVFKSLGSIGLPTFEILDDKGAVIDTITARDVTPAAKQVWELDGSNKPKLDDAGLKVPKLDEEGKPVMREFPNIRIELDGGDYQEFPRKSIKKKAAGEPEIVKAFEDVVWGNAAEILKVLFPDDANRYSEQYIENHLNVPFLKALIGLVINMNGLDFIIPFMSEFFPAIGLLFGKGQSQKKQTSTIG